MMMEMIVVEWWRCREGFYKCSARGCEDGDDPDKVREDDFF